VRWKVVVTMMMVVVVGDVGRGRRGEGWSDYLFVPATGLVGIGISAD